MKWVLVAGLVGLAALISPAALDALGRPELGLLASGLRMPAGVVWLVGPMLLGIAGAVTVGWRRATTGGNGGGPDRR